jgi:hypothetical protein
MMPTKEDFERARSKFEMETEATCLEIIEISKQISSAIGEISIMEAKHVLIREFRARLTIGRHHAEFKGKIK